MLPWVLDGNTWRADFPSYNSQGLNLSFPILLVLLWLVSIWQWQKIWIPWASYSKEFIIIVTVIVAVVIIVVIIIIIFAQKCFILFQVKISKERVCLYFNNFTCLFWSRGLMPCRTLGRSFSFTTFLCYVKLQSGSGIPGAEPQKHSALIPTAEGNENSIVNASAGNASRSILCRSCNGWHRERSWWSKLGW